MHERLTLSDGSERVAPVDEVSYFLECELRGFPFRPLVFVEGRHGVAVAAKGIIGVGEQDKCAGLGGIEFFDALVDADCLGERVKLRRHEGIEGGFVIVARIFVDKGTQHAG